MAKVTPNEIECPNDLAAAVTVPPTNGMMRAGQHQAPTTAGMDNTSINKLQQRALLSDLAFSAFSTSIDGSPFKALS
jgi:hypothetical protein